MQNKSTRSIAAIAVVVAFLGVASISSAADKNHRYVFGGPTGVWLLNVEFPVVPGAPPPPPPFQETLTLHALGTVSEMNTLLNENSYNPAIGQGCGFTGPGGSLQLNCNGSVGTGSWHRTGRRTVSFVFVKFVYDGETNEHVGFLRVSSKKLTFSKNKVKQDAADTLTEFLVGSDYDTAIAIPLGGAKSTGQRIR